MALDSGTAYLGGSDRRVVAVDLASGRTRWSRRLSGPIVGGVLRAGTAVYAATDRPGGRVYAFDTVSGKQLWSTGTGFVEAPLALADGVLIALNRQSQVMGLDPTTGHIRWRHPLPSQRIGPIPLGGDRVLVSSFDSLYVVQVKDGFARLRRRAPGAITSPWVQVGDALVAGTGDSLVVALTPDSLQVLWKVRLDGPLLTSPAARGDTVYGVTQLGSLYRIIPGAPPEVTLLREQRWPATGAPALFGPWVLVGGSEGRLHAFRSDDGGEAWSASLGRPLELAPLILGDSDFLALGGRGDLHRMRL
jgi:outer membrane protein assembly factor BamB